MKAYLALVLAIAAPVFAEELQARGGGGGGEGGGYGGGGQPTTTWGEGGGGGYSTTTDVVYTSSMYFHFIPSPFEVEPGSSIHLLSYPRPTPLPLLHASLALLHLMRYCIS